MNISLKIEGKAQSGVSVCCHLNDVYFYFLILDFDPLKFSLTMALDNPIRVDMP